MKITLLHGKKRLVVEIGENDTVGTLKNFFRDQFSLNLKSSGDTEDVILNIIYAGAHLKDDWIISDIGILPGSILQCFLQSRDKIFMRAYAPFKKKTYDFTTPLNVEKTTIEEFKTMLQDVSGIPVSVMRLSKAPSGIELFDNRLLDDYDIMIGDTIHVDIWDGMGELLQSSFAGDVTATMNAIVPSMEDPALHKYQLRVALFVASFYGYIQLVSQLLKTGARCDDPVGEHPAKDWCKSSLSHPLTLRTPAHAAAQNGKISCLRLFIHHNRACILAKDGYGWTPTGVARRYGQRECFKLLITEQFRKQQYGGLSLSMYGKVRKWCDRARDRVAYYRLDPNFPVLLSTSDKSGHAAVVGSLIQVSGFGETIQTSANKLNKSKIDAKNQWLWPRREELATMAKMAYDKKASKKPYRTMPLARKQNSLKSKLSMKRSNSLESVVSSRESSDLKRSWNEDNLKGRFRTKLPIIEKDTSCELGCTCKNCSVRPCESPVRFPEIQQSVSKSRKVSSPEAFFITQDVRSQSQIIHEETEPNSVAGSVNLDGNSRSRSKEVSASPRSKHYANKILAEQAHSVIEQATGQTSKQLARSSLQVCETFTAVGWLRRLHLATNYNKKTLLRSMRDKGQSLATKSCPPP